MSEVLGLERAGELLAELLPERGPVGAVSRFAEGSVTGAYRVEFADARSAPVVLKIYGADKLPWATKEALALRFLTDHGIEISPRMLAFGKASETLGGRSCVVSALMAGRTLERLAG